MSQVLDTDAASSSPDEPPARRDAPETPARGDWWWRGLRPLVRRLHFTIGLFVGPFLFVAALTGLLYTITPQLEDAVYHDALHTASTGAALPLSAQVGVAAAAVPGGTVTAIRPPRVSDGTTRVMFQAPDVAPDDSRTAFVDPHTGQVRAVLDTVGEWLPLRGWFDTLHRTLLLGDVGRVYSELAASWLWVLTLAGLAIWVVRRGRTRRLRRTLLPETSGPRRLRSWHASVGLWAAAGLLFLSATGLTWSQFAGENVTTLRSDLDWKTPSVSTTLPSVPADGPLAVPATSAVPTDPTPPATDDPAALGTTADRALAGAHQAGLSDPVEIVPASRGEAWTVTQVQRSWPEKQDAVAVDPGTGRVIDTVRFADWPLPAKLARWGVDAHMGLLFGWVSQVFLAALALAVMCLVVWGYRMWWKRRPTRGGLAGSPAGSQPPGPGAVIVVGLVAIVVGLALPVLGVSLLAFLLADLLRGVVVSVRGRRGERREAVERVPAA